MERQTAQFARLSNLRVSGCPTAALIQDRFREAAYRLLVAASRTLRCARGWVPRSLIPVTRGEWEGAQGEETCIVHGPVARRDGLHSGEFGRQRRKQPDQHSRQSDLLVPCHVLDCSRSLGAIGYMEGSLSDPQSVFEARLILSGSTPPTSPAASSNTWTQRSRAWCCAHLS